MRQLLDRSVDLASAFQSYWKTTTELPTLGIAVLDERGICAFANRTFRRLMYHDEEFNPSGLSVDDLEGSQMAHEIRGHVQSICQTGDARLVRFTRFGTRLECSLTPWRPNGPDDNVMLVVCFVHACVETEQDSIEFPAYESDFNSWGELDLLTNRQLEVLACLRLGMSQKQIAEQLGIAPKTVETHRDQMVNRLGLSSTIEAIRLADRAGLTLDNARKPRYRDRPWQSARDRLPESNQRDNDQRNRDQSSGVA